MDVTSLRGGRDEWTLDQVVGYLTHRARTTFDRRGATSWNLTDARAVLFLCDAVGESRAVGVKGHVQAVYDELGAVDG